MHLFKNRKKQALTPTIKGFFKENRWLSNFWECEVTIGSRTYSSSEAAYQAMKSRYSKVRAQFVNISAREAKSLGRRIEIRSDWERRKVFYMRSVLEAKFTQNPELREKLIATGNAYLEETNYWGDKFWGVCNGQGENKLGKLLMKLREELKAV